MANLGFNKPIWFELRTTAQGNQYIEMPQTADGDSIFLTEFHHTDGPAMVAALNFPELNDRLLSLPKPYKAADAENWITLQRSGASALALSALRSGDPETGEFIGSVAVIPSSAAPSRALLAAPEGTLSDEYELGYWLSPHYHRKGIMKNAVLAVLTWATEFKGVKTIAVGADETNKASVRLIESIPVFIRVGHASVIDWPESKGGGQKTVHHWRWQL